MKPLVKITEYYDSNECVGKIDAICSGCGKHTLKIVKKYGLLVVNEYVKCDCPDVFSFDDIPDEIAAHDAYVKSALISDKFDKDFVLVETFPAVSELSPA